MLPDTADDILISRIIKGDRSSFSTLVGQYQNLVFTLAFRITGNREEAEEVAQDVFVKVYNNLATFKGESKFSSWLYRIAHNTALTKIRNKKPVHQPIHNFETGNSTTPQNSVANTAEQTFTREYVNKAICLLEPDEATIITLFYLSEQNLDEIAGVLNIEPNAAKVRLHRARKRLREKLELIG